MTEGWMPCSDRSLERADPLAGTSGFGERWFLVEIEGAWGMHAFFQSRLDPDISRRLVARVEAARMRPLAIRRTGRRPERSEEQTAWRWAIVDARPGHEEVRWGTVDQAADLLDVPLDGSAGEASTDPVICVCTHARHDQCCAVKGRPVVGALAVNYPDFTWECSHLGGDRFAATMIVFPHGLHYGRVEAAETTGIIERYLAGEIAPARFRGRSSSTNVVQAAEAAAREWSGDYRIDSMIAISETSTAAGSTVVFEHGQATITVELAPTLSEPLLSTCGATRAAPVRQFDLVAIG